jgi:hypothetical protein
MYFRYWVFRSGARESMVIQGEPPEDSSESMFIEAPDQDSATRLTERRWPVSTHLHVREITADDLPAGAEWQK